MTVSEVVTREKSWNTVRTNIFQLILYFVCSQNLGQLTKKLSNKSIKKLCYKRPEISGEGLKMDDTYVDYKTLLESDEWDEEDAEMVPSGHHLYIR